MRNLFVFILLVYCLQLTHANTLIITFLGDTHFGDNYQLSPYYNHGVNVIDKYRYDYFFENVKDLLLTSDLTIANLETPLTDTIKPEYFSSKSIIHFSDKDSTPYYLSKYHIQAVNIANNHTMDFGFSVLKNTIYSLNKYYISPFGAGLNEREASIHYLKKLIINGNEFNIYVLGCYWYRTRYDKERKIYAHGDTGGVRLLESDKLCKQIQEIKQSDEHAFIVIYPHWGSNYEQANEYQREAARGLIDCGVDLIIGHGAHTIQETENYKGKWIFYNLGNFIFNSPGRYKSRGVKPYGLILQLLVNEKGYSLRLYPIFTDNKKSNYQIRFLYKEEFMDCYDYMVTDDMLKKRIKIYCYQYFEIGTNK